MSQSFPKRARLRKPAAFRRAFDKGKKHVGRYFVVFNAEGTTDEPRLGLAIGRRAGNAVARNRLKRVVRESFRFHSSDLPARDLVVIARTKARQASRDALFRDLAHIWREFDHD